MNFASIEHIARPRTTATRRRGIGLAWLAALAALLLPASAGAYWNKEWPYRKQIVITAPPAGSTSGAGPVLIRLHEGVLNFADTMPNGEDLRFVAEDDQTPLKFHVEKFDAVFNLAFVWVQVPQLAPGAPAKIWMYYGNAKAVAGSEPGASWDAGQTLVYHFGERGAPPVDATQFGNNGTGAIAQDDGGLIGSAAKFDGQSVLALPASPSLALAAGADATVSLWLKPATAAQDAVLYAQRDGTVALRIGLAQGTPFIAFTDAASVEQRAAASAPIAGTDWHHIAFTSTAAQLTLYVDGKQAATLATALPALAAGATVGGEGGANGEPVTAGFSGEIDELRIAKAAREAGAIAIAAQNEGPADGMVEFGADEVQSTWSTGYVGIILGSVTLDGWVIIGLLIVMMLVSWYVMAIKAHQIGRVARANKMFLQLFRSSGGDFSQLDNLTGKGSGKLNGKDGKLLQASPLLHVYRGGVDELRGRLARNVAAGAVLSAQSIAAIRASIDSRIVQEQQSLSSRMVLLTIAISGGPFIGLLGTVVGVMITFAGVAAAGDVNINAIAPGISAALAATVAGLFVAIPALFGYNYLITRIKECSAEMHVFVDAFITGIAESYNSPAVLHAMSDG